MKKKTTSRIVTTNKSSHRPHKTAGQFLKDARITRGYTLKGAMSEIGLTGATAPQHLMRIEAGIQRLPFDRMDSLCALYGIRTIDVRRLYAQWEIDKIMLKYGLESIKL